MQKNVKKSKVWDDAPSQKKLDFTEADERGDGAMEVVSVNHGKSLMDKVKVVSSDSENEEEDVEESETLILSEIRLVLLSVS